MNQKSIIAAVFAAAVLPTHAASDLANPLNTYVGTSQSNFPAQPAFLATSGLEVSFVWDGGDGAWEKIGFNDTAAVLPSLPGATFGIDRGGDDGRNYLRTVETDYHTKDFTAFVTVNRPAQIGTAGRPAVFFGIGTAQLKNTAGGPDRGTNNASAFIELQAGFDNASRRVTGNGINSELGYTGMTQVANSALRMRMEYNGTTQQITFALDYDYDGTFVAEQSFTHGIAAQAFEWFSGDRASIFFGGDRKAVFTDLVITTTQTVAPPAVTGLNVTSFGDSTISLAWDQPTPGTTFSVYRSTTDGDFSALDARIATDLTSPSYTDNAVTNETPYYYVVTQTSASAANPSAFSNQVSATPTAGAVTPTGMSARNAGVGAVLVDWDTLLTPFDKYTVYRSTDGVVFSILADNLSESRHLDESAATGTPYTYRVTSTRSGIESAPTPDSQAIAKNLEVFVDFFQSANTDAGAAATVAGTSWNTLGGGVVATPTLLDSTEVPTSVGLNTTGGGTFAAVSGANVGGNKTAGSQTLTESYNLMVDYAFAGFQTYTITGLVPNRKYDLYFYGYGDTVGQNTGFEVDSIVKQTKDPSGLIELTEGRHYVTFTALANVDGQVSFDWGIPGNVSPSLTDADAGGGNGAINGFQLVENSTAVLQPIGLIATANETSLDLLWDDVPGATSYKIYRSATPASGYTLLAPSPTSTYSDTTAVAGTTYYYVVTALNGPIESFVSAEASGMRVPLIVDTDRDGLSDADEALIGTDPNNPRDFFVTTSSTVTPAAGNFDVSFVINGAQGDYVIERSATLLDGSWVEVAGSQVSWTWTNGVLDDLIVSAPALAPASGGKEFFRVKGVVPAPPN
jgi:fibronectin type 3 domain-containing protein